MTLIQTMEAEAVERERAHVREHECHHAGCDAAIDTTVECMFCQENFCAAHMSPDDPRMCLGCAEGMDANE